MANKEQVNSEHLPAHVAVIMDGNGRWARKKGNKRIFGHKNGVRSVREITEAAAEIGVPYLTLYAFSKENWERPKSEVSSLMSLLVETLHGESKKLMKNGVELNVIGDMESLPDKVVRELNKMIKETSGNNRLKLNLALSYGARWEITNACRLLAEKVKTGAIEPNEISNDMFTQQLTTGDMPDPELLIRTGGEQRVSNFLLWQISYAELYFTSTLWPDFRKEDFFDAIVEYQRRERRFGKTSEQAKKKL